MICPPCRVGGDIAEAVRRGSLGPKALLKAAERHQSCVGQSWCDCQHRLPKEIQP